MRVAFPISGGLVDLEAGCLLREGQVVTLSTAEIGVIGYLYERQRRLVDLADVARATWIGRDATDDLRLLLRVLERRLGAAAGLRPVLRLRDDQVGLWPERGAVARPFSTVLLAIGLAARRLAFREAPDRTQALWEAERARWIQAADPAGGLAFEEGAGALVLRFDDPAGLLAWIDATLEAGDPETTERLRLSIDVVRWPAGLAERALEVGIRRLSRIWEHTARSCVTLSERALRVCDDGRAFRPIGSVGLDPAGPPEVICAVRGDGPLLPASPEPVLPRPPVLPRSLDLRDAVLAALDGGSGLIVLHGESGLGKTDLAIQVAGIMQRRLRGRGGARFVRLGDGEAGVAEQVASELGLLGIDDPLVEVGRALGELGDSLLVLDGFERSETGSAASVAAWRAAAPRCALLLTSPEPLRIAGAVNVAIEAWSPETGVDVLRRALARRGVLLPDDPEIDRQLARIVQAVEGYALNLVVAASLIASDGIEAALQALERVAATVRGDRLSAVLRLARGRLPEPLQRGLDGLGVLRGDFDATVAADFFDGSIPLPDALMRLVDSGLLRARADAVLGEPRFSLPGPVLRALDIQLPRAERQRLRGAALHALAARAARWAAALDAGDDERPHLRRLTIHRSELLEVLPSLRDPAVVDGVVGGLLRLAGLGRIDLAGLAAVVAGAPETPNVSLARARALLLAGRPTAAADIAGALAQRPSPVGEQATVLHLAATRSMTPYGRARASLVSILRRWIEDEDPRCLPAAGVVLDALLAHELVGDAALLGNVLAQVAAASGSVWRRAVVAVHRYRARALLSRCGPHDDAALIQAIVVLQEVGDHRVACLGLQWLARRKVAEGEPLAGLCLLARVQGYLDVYAGAALRPVLAMDRARALALAGEPDRAQELLRELRDAPATALRLPAAVCAIDGALAALIAGDVAGAGAWLRVDDPGAAPPAYALILSQLRRFVGGEGPVGPVAKGSDDAILADLAEVWDDPDGLRRTAARVRRHPAFRALGLRGALLRALVAAAEGRAAR